MTQFVDAIAANAVSLRDSVSRALENYFGHVEVDANEAIYRDDKNNIPEIDAKATFSLGDSIIVNGTIQ